MATTVKAPAGLSVPPGSPGSPLDIQEMARALARSPSLLPSWALATADSRPFHARNSVVAPAHATLTEVTVFTVPPGAYGVLLGIFNVFQGAGFVDGSGDVVWTLDVNLPIGITSGAGYTLRDYARILTRLGNYDAPWPIPGGLLLQPQDTLRYKVTTGGATGVGAPNYVTCALIGRVWPFNPAGLPALLKERG